MWQFFKKLVGGELRNAQRETESASEAAGTASKRYTLRMGELVEADEVFDAWTSGDLANMLKVLHTKTNLIDRHFLLMGIVAETYKQRKIDIEMRNLCKRIAELHIQEFADIVHAFRKDMAGMLPRVTTFQNFATVLSEDGEYEKAIEVCQKAISFGLHDGTQSGYEGRIARITKKMGTNP